MVIVTVTIGSDIRLEQKIARDSGCWIEDHTVTKMTRWNSRRKFFSQYESTLYLVSSMISLSRTGARGVQTKIDDTLTELKLNTVIARVDYC